MRRGCACGLARCVGERLCESAESKQEKAGGRWRKKGRQRERETGRSGLGRRGQAAEIGG